MEYVQLIGGLIVLILAGEALVRGAVALALRFKISPLVVGMTIVSFGTSAPELLVSIRAALDGHPELAIGNVLGSNIANLALVLGLSTIIFPITIKRTTKVLDWPVMMLATVIFYLFALNKNFEWWEGFIYVLGLIIFNIYLFWKSIKENKLLEKQGLGEVCAEDELTLFKSIFYIVLGGSWFSLWSEVVVGRSSYYCTKFRSKRACNRSYNTCFWDKCSRINNLNCSCF